MALSKRSTLAVCGIAAGAALLVALALSPALAGNAPATALVQGGCSATGHIDNQWATGENVTVTVTNTSATAATKWAVTWDLVGSEKVAAAWNAVVSTAGTTVTAVNASYNGNLAPGASTTFGMQLWGISTVPALSCANDASTPTSPPPSNGTDVLLTLADNQRMLTVLVGQTIRVDLRSDFRPTTATTPALSQVRVSGGYPTGLPMSAVYRAVSPGSGDLATHTDNACNYTTPPCGAPVQLWTVHINVITAPTDGRTVTVTTADNGSTTTLFVGDTLVVSLPAEYQPPAVVPGGVLVQRDATGGYPTGRPFLAHYAVTTLGEVDLSSVTDAACVHGPTPCPTPQIPWKVHVTVTLMNSAPAG
jgi:hypothetical protein